MHPTSAFASTRPLAARWARRLSALRALYGRRRMRVLAAATLLLLPSLAVLELSALRARQARTDLALSQSRLDAASALDAAAHKDTERDRLRAKLVQEARRAGLSGQDWEERRFNIKQASMPRDAVNSLLAELGRSRGRLFAAEQFDLAVSRPEEDLFTPPQQAPAELLVTLKGRLVFREGGAKP